MTIRKSRRRAVVLGYQVKPTRYVLIRHLPLLRLDKTTGAPER
jgi:hypothetical protein